MVVRQNIRLILLIILFALFAQFPVLESVLLTNSGWLQLIRAQADREVAPKIAAASLSSFQRAVAQVFHPYAYLGMGFAYALIGDGDAALFEWRKAQVPPYLLVSIGNDANAGHNWDKALLYYRSAAMLGDGKAPFLAGNVCQRVFPQSDLLDRTNQVYCRDLLFENDNLIVNNQFSEGHDWGWNRRYFSSVEAVRYEVDQEAGRSAPSARIIGLTDAYHGGLFQRIKLPPGLVVRYSGWFKVQAAGDVRVRLLYFGGRSQGEPFGRALRTIKGDIDWTYWETTITIPESDERLFRFFPVLLTGRGVVWLDDVRLEPVPE